MGYFLGFIAPLRDPQGRFRASWGGQPTMYDYWTKESYSGFVAESGYHKARITELQDRGCEVIFSVGGAAAAPLEEKIEPTEAVTEYLACLDNYNTSYLDFDIEGSALTSPEMMDRHIQVLLGLRDQRPDLRISHTFAVDIDGWNHHTIALVKKMAAVEYVPDIVQGMLMEMRDPDNDYWKATRMAAEAMVTQMTDSSAWGHVWDRPAAYRHFGACPMYGVNNNNKIFTLEHMEKLLHYAKEHQIAVLSGWDAWRDNNQCNPEAGINPPCKTVPPLSHADNKYACTHVQQQPGEFSRLVAAYTPQTVAR
ncbi:hypothetical protein RKE29_23795 [Streptomyces sp. B1866]|uniref:hypothetical protein n=1 Tax=Streptomyces sp. B1866 TaxID=3075431 RepID=UPI00288D40DE|nr:hypothetical protein [Streptomyces sp. B1866]MDT3399627.1 hypothetical protein [Streptomyces sp. B1866]